MRITGGTLKNRQIICPKGIIRPAMDRMRESLFAILGDLHGLSFLDLFSGSGICGLEAYSRGAYPVVLVEKDTAKFPVLLKNASMAEKRINCKNLSVELYLKRTQEQFDIIYIDPPFPYRFHQDLLYSIGESSVLCDKGLVLMHRPKEKELPDRIGSLQRVDQRIYGRSIVDFYQKSV
ncbi:16S rRNA (guanine(966)-N(2))-methyltransferase RsmD [Treponema phagedenis]|uniref:16S rRNA (Guanine(966)-N(2))-methyltransferase RsmD n=1 Tax=Treponema phagedenis TaxID=162 RepID=A0A0B7H1B9_TREPH|nr:16S rRNA (guanine(966)-N(2))-methyltransferase RsmD [Treponema phagedenis]EFW37868.1 RNA methyltransferase, RsmD family [Treponema phagedenis F0421]NVP23031.1 16S rRNA (guanine(966)-N(2))-methyltransferase RsmD [Treponema phagedenis]QEJ96471.1 16S rRNA (guanine(966)-N(2))-methyltransferase RsmD [Treponema phagedenis]QEJ99623.1 16S rRNA (guanine(966)-N(2))-methyltransferase RsmD [Treponema phagedenis]QEK02255.1 16S rRNA (guanine(966)-N(2))-methyltransferase RsmD [Treponema phagedenis]